MASHIDDLRSALSHSLLGNPQAHQPGGSLPEHQLIDRLVDAVEGHDVGDLSVPRLRKIFQNNPVPSFDFDQWLTDMVGQGVYDEDILEDDDEWELEYE